MKKTPLFQNMQLVPGITSVLLISFPPFDCCECYIMKNSRILLKSNILAMSQFSTLVIWDRSDVDRLHGGSTCITYCKGSMSLSAVDCSRWRIWEDSEDMLISASLPVLAVSL